MYDIVSTGKEPNVCSEHGEYISHHISFKDKDRWTKCPWCVRRDAGVATLQQIDKNRADSLKTALETTFNQAMIPRKFLDKDFANYSIKTDAQRIVLAKSKYFADNFNLAKQKGINCIFAGNVGNGKTHLACAILQQIMTKGYSGIFIKMADISINIRSGYSKKIAEDDILNNYINLDCLVIDECLVASKEFELGKLTYIIDKRYERMNPTILITNDINDLKKTLGNRIVDRMLESNMCLMFGWESYRTGDKYDKE